MNKIILIIFVVYSTFGFSQNNKSNQKNRDIISRDSIYYFPVWEVKNEKLFSTFDRIIEKNKKCLKKKKWNSVGNDYFFDIGIFNYQNSFDSCNTLNVDIAAHVGTELIETFIMSYASSDKSSNVPYSGVIIYKNEIFMIWNNPKLNDFIPFISKTKKTHGVLIRDNSYIYIERGDVIVYKLGYEYLYKNGNFKLIKKECCP